MNSDPMIMLNKRFKTSVHEIFPRFIMCYHSQTKGHRHKIASLVFAATRCNKDSVGLVCNHCYLS